ncbi:hypothetical protein WCE55_08005 [Luteimonas sp. MJ293]|uniref:hypothetical protein n=1 Tax=Luteimonas sp. MJ146 TaxID=3129240 RepID=UPI0031B9CBA6
MSGDTHNSQRVDQIARSLHASAVAHVPAQTLARLRPRPQSAPARPTWLARPAGWGLATACAAMFVFAAGLYVLVSPDALGPQPFPVETMADSGAPAAAPAFDPYDDPLSTFDEDPDLFVWLASDAQPVAME